jgi:hypothetical protein
MRLPLAMPSPGCALISIGIVIECRVRRTVVDIRNAGKLLRGVISIRRVLAGVLRVAVAERGRRAVGVVAPGVGGDGVAAARVRQAGHVPGGIVAIAARRHELGDAGRQRGVALDRIEPPVREVAEIDPILRYTDARLDATHFTYVTWIWWMARMAPLFLLHSSDTFCPPALGGRIGFHAVTDRGISG